MPATVKTVIDQKAFLDSVQKGVDMANRRVKSSANKIKLSIDDKGFRQPLGRITGDLKMFDSALAASNARVIAFGASTAVIGGISKAFKELARTTIEVGKQFADINRILSLSNKNFEKFGNELFSISQKNATAFQDTTKAALEFARQGLKVEDTLKRTSDALTLVRLTGINADKAVATLTATVNAFEGSMLDTTTAVNKFVAVETKFAVGARDLVEAIGRVGSSAIDAKVGFDELNAMVTSVQQTTGRGGAVIGNAMKTIFTRLQRQSTLEALESYNVAVRDVEGNTLPAMRILDNFARSYAGLADASQSYLREQVAGVFQANILSAILKDLNKQQSTYSSALDVSKGATDEANQATAELNKTLSALANQTGLEFQKLQANIGKATFEPVAKELLLPLKNLMKGINDVIDGEGAGSEIANGLLKGLRNILGGPGLVAAIGLIGKVFLNTTSYIVKSLPALAGITTETQKRANLEKTIQSIMERESTLASAIDGFTGDTARQASLIATYAELAAQDMERQDKAVKSMATTLRTMPGALTALSKTTGGTQLGQPKAPRGASGFIPGMAGEVHDIRRGVGGVSSSARPVTIPNFAFGRGRRGTMIANTGEYIVPNFSNGGSAIFNPNMIAQYGMPAGAKPIRGAGGYVPNFVGGGDVNKAIQTLSGMTKTGRSYSEQDQATMASIGKEFGVATKGYGPASIIQRLERSKGRRAKEAKMFDATSFADMLVPTRGHKSSKFLKFKSADKVKQYGAEGVIFNRRGIANNAENQLSNLVRIDEVLDDSIVSAANTVIGSIHPEFVKKIPVSERELQPFMSKEGAPGAIAALKGAFFEALIGRMVSDKNATPDGMTLDTVMSPAVKKLFVGGMKTSASFGDFKGSVSQGNDGKFAEQVLKNRGRAAGGYIPNFAGLGAAVEREVAAGVPLGSIRVGRSSKLSSPNNPAGLAVTNTRDEPRGLMDVVGASKGYIPNFASPADFLKGIVSSKNPAFNKVVKMMEQFGQELTEGKINQDQYNANVKAATQKMGMNKTQMSRVNAAAGKFAVATEQAATAAKANKGGFMSGAGGMGVMMGLSMGLPMLAGAAEQAGAGRATTGAMTGAATGASIGMILGPKGALVGAAIGGLANLAIQANKVGLDFETLSGNLQNFERETQEQTTAAEEYIQAQRDLASATTDAELEDAQKRIAKNFNAITDTDLQSSFAEAGTNVNEMVTSLKAYTDSVEREGMFRRAMTTGARVKDRLAATETDVKQRVGKRSKRIGTKVDEERRSLLLNQIFGDFFREGLISEIDAIEMEAVAAQLDANPYGDVTEDARAALLKQVEAIAPQAFSRFTDEEKESLFNPEVIKAMRTSFVAAFDITDKTMQALKKQAEETKELNDSLVAASKRISESANAVKSSTLLKFKDSFVKLNSALSSIGSDIRSVIGDDVGAARFRADAANRGRGITQTATRRSFGLEAQSKLFGESFKKEFTQNASTIQMMEALSTEFLQNPQQAIDTLRFETESGMFAKRQGENPTAFKFRERAQELIRAFEIQEKNIEAENAIAKAQQNIEMIKAKNMVAQRDLQAKEKLLLTERNSATRLEEMRIQQEIDMFKIRAGDPARSRGLTNLENQQRLFNDQKTILEKQIAMDELRVAADNANLEAEMNSQKLLIESNQALIGADVELTQATEKLAAVMVGEALGKEFDKGGTFAIKGGATATSPEALRKMYIDQNLEKMGFSKIGTAGGGGAGGRSTSTEKAASIQKQINQLETQYNANVKANNTELKERIDDLREQLNLEEEIGMREAKRDTEFKAGLQEGFDTIYKDIDHVYNRLGKDLPTAFRDGMVNALEASLDKAETFGDAMRGVAIDMLKMIRRASLQYSMDNFTSLIGMGASKGFRESGTRLQNGAFVPGTGSGDRIPAMLESGEYVVNRKAVQGVGRSTLDYLNFRAFPRFAQSGGMMGINESVRSNRMSGFFLASDNPELEEAREAERARLARKEAKKAEKKQLLSTFLTTLATVGVGKLSDMAADKFGRGSGKLTVTENRSKGLPEFPQGQKGGLIGSGFTNRDSVPAYMAGGEFVMNNRAVRKYGLGFMGRLNGGLIPTMQTGGMVGAESAPLNAQTAANTNNISINVTVGGGGSGGGQGGTAGTGNENASQRTNVDQATQGKELSERIRGAVLEVIQQEQRLGGSLSRSSRP